MTLCSTLLSALSSGQKPLLTQGEEKVPTFHQSQVLNRVSFYDSMNETWLHIDVHFVVQCPFKNETTHDMN